jgi:hypothetical protein
LGIDEEVIPMNDLYEVLNPWAEVDPIPLRGLSPRLSNLAGKKVGLSCNSKLASKSILTEIEKKLKERFPTCETSWYIDSEPYLHRQNPRKDKSKFEEWVSGVDAIIAAVGD